MLLETIHLFFFFREYCRYVGAGETFEHDKYSARFIKYMGL